MCSNTIALTARKIGQVSLEHTITMADHKLGQILDGYDKRPSTFQLAIVVDCTAYSTWGILSHVLRGNEYYVHKIAVHGRENMKRRGVKL